MHPHLMHGFWAHTSLPKRHLDRFSRLCKARTQTTKRATSAAIGRVYVGAMQPSNTQDVYQLPRCCVVGSHALDMTSVAKYELVLRNVGIYRETPIIVAR